MGRRDALVQVISSNPKAKFVTRLVQFGSEPLFDHVLSPSQLAQQVTSLNSQLKPYGIPVTISDLRVGWSRADALIKEVPLFDVHELPFFSGSATTGEWCN
jgi:exo-beta-1,3-glucanase (GH17 family)